MAEVIVYYSSPKTSGETTYLTVFDMDGNQLPGWPQEAARSVSRMGPALADATGDGILDIVLPMYGIGSGDTKFDCSPLVYTKEGLQSNPSCYYGHDNLPAVVDFNGDGQPNVVTTSSSFRAINVMEKFYDSTGNLGWKVLWEKKPGIIQIQPIVSDMDQNGKWEIIGLVETSTGTSIYVWEPPASNSLNGPAWSQYINDETRSGSFLSINREETPSPTTSITSPSDASIVSGTIDVIVTASDNVGVSKVELYRNNVLVGTKTSSPYIFGWDTTQEENGQYILQSKAYNETNDAGISSLITVNVNNDNTAPTVSITSPSDTSTVSGTIDVIISASDNVGVNKVELYRNNVLVGTKTSSPYIFTWDTTQEENGEYTLQPTVSITSPSDTSTLTGLVDITVSASDNVGVSIVELYRNDVLVGTKTSGPLIFTWDTTQKENGEYTLQSKAYDEANNAAISSLITVNVNNDNTAPTVSITSPLNNNNVQRKSTITITASAADNVGVTKVEFYVDNNLICVDTSEGYTCEWEVPARPGVTHILQANAYDANSNVGSSAIIEITSKK